MTSVTCLLLVVVGSIWFPFPFLILGISGKCYFSFSFWSEGLVLLFFADVLLSQ